MVESRSAWPARLAITIAWLGTTSVTSLSGCGDSQKSPDDADASAGADAGNGGDDASNGSDDASVKGDAAKDGAGATDSGSADAGATTPVITLGAKDRFLLLGTVVTPDVTMEGAVLVEQNKITCVDIESVCRGMPNAPGATIIDTKGIILPGLVDTHNHILFDIFDDSDWLPAQLYQNHDQWPSEPKYQAMLDVKQCLSNDSQGKPTWCAQTSYGTPAGSLRCEMDKWGELKGVISGTTSIVGLPGTSAPCFGSLARSIDVPQNGLGQDKVQTSATFPPSNPDGVCANFTSGATNAFIVHAGEGIDQTSLDEFAKLGSISTTPGCLYAAPTSITHGVAFGATEFGVMANAGMRLTWSPHSNVSLYGATANIPLAQAAGIEIAIAPDWSMGGSQNMMEELQFARDWDKTHFGSMFASKDLVRMATVIPAKLLGMSTLIGSLAPTMLADITVIAGDRTTPYDAIINAKPNDVRLVLVDGVPLYGDATLAAAGPSAPGCETLSLCTHPKFICVATASAGATDKLDQTLVTIKAALETALTDADTQTPGDGFNFAPLAPLYNCK